MNTRKCKLNYGKLNVENVEELIFTSSKKRFDFISSVIINQDYMYKKVFLLAIEKDYLEPPHKDPETDIIYIFEQYRDINFLSNHENGKWMDIFLFEFSSYEDAYEFALMMREPNKLCYKNNQPPLEVI